MIEKVNGIVCKVVEKEENVYFDMALTMLEEIIRHNEKNEPTVMIVPPDRATMSPAAASVADAGVPGICTSPRAR